MQDCMSIWFRTLDRDRRAFGKQTNEHVRKALVHSLLCSWPCRGVFVTAAGVSFSHIKASCSAQTFYIPLINLPLRFAVDRLNCDRLMSPRLVPVSLSMFL
jgi:hypothetical protein